MAIPMDAFGPIGSLRRRYVAKGGADLCDELLIESVDACDCFVEFAIGVANEGVGALLPSLPRVLSGCPHVECDGALPIGWRRQAPMSCHEKR